MEDALETSAAQGNHAVVVAGLGQMLDRMPILMLEKDVFAHPELGPWAQALFDTWKNEGSASRGIAHIAPNLFIGSGRQGYFHYSRHRKIVLVYAYTGPDDCFQAIAGELLTHCDRRGYQLNFLFHKPISSIGDVTFSATPFGVVQRVADLPAFTLKGAAMQRLRYQVSAFKKAGTCEVVEYRCGTQPAVDSEIARVIDSWCAGKTMVNPLVRAAKEEILTGSLHPRHRLFLTRVNDVLQNVVLISPLCQADNGYLMDLEFYGSDMPRGGLEFSIVSIIETLVAEGRTMLSLGGTYGCRIEQSENADPEVDKLLDDLHKQNIFNDQGNFQFKNKFRPQAQTIYLCRKAGCGNPDSVIDIIMMIADPSRAQTSDAENHTGMPSTERPPEQKTGDTAVDGMRMTKDPLAESVQGAEKKKNPELLALAVESETAESAAAVGAESSIPDGPRSRMLAAASYNPLRLSHAEVDFDLKTDSWAQLAMPVIESRMKQLHDRLQQPGDDNESLREVFPFAYFVHTESGRTAEQALYRAWPKKGTVLQNVLFPTNLVHQIENDFKPKELPCPAFFRLDLDEPGKSDLAMQTLAEVLADNPQAVVMVFVEVSNNAAGGHPVSVAHLREIKALLRPYAIPLVLDATRILENASFLLARESEPAGNDLWRVAREVLSCADTVVASLPKDFGINKGGLLATNNAVLYRAASAAVAEAGTGLDAFDRKLVSLSLRDQRHLERLVADRIGAVRVIWSVLKERGVPIVCPAGAHCVLVDVKRLSYFAGFEHPVASFVAWLYLNTGIRAGAHSVGMQRRTETAKLVRLAVPMGLSRPQVDEIARRLVGLFDRMTNIPELVLAEETRGSFGEMTTKYTIKQYHNVSADAQDPMIAVPTATAHSLQISEQVTESERLTSSEEIVSSELQESDTGEQEIDNVDSTRSLPSAESTNARRVRDIAIVGMAGRYPMAKNIGELWENLKQGRDCIEELPTERYEQRLRYGPVERYRGGFIDAVDKFDSVFFNIPPKDAERLDPQERLFVEVAWETLEDAGYYPELINREEGADRVGVYVGAVWATYQAVGIEEKHLGGSHSPNSFLWSIANRVSYWMNFSGPSLTIDTACSSSLTALYLACEAIYAGECGSAIVGGVNLDLHQCKWDINWSGGALSKDGLCRSFGHGANGYVAGEGVGAVYIKPLDQAVEDGDNIYGVIKSVVVNHGGRTSGFIVPNPKAQTNLIRTALERANVDASSIGYIEAHGTGTELGDPLEISALNNAFRSHPVSKNSCAVGSLKSNIGHLEAAAGVASLSKVLLQMQHRQLVPSLHSSVLNDYIDFENSPFHIQQNLEEWTSKDIDGIRLPLRAGISSFGAGGSNAHVIVENYEPPTLDEAPASGREVHIFPLSARTEAQLSDVATRLHDFLERADASESIRDVAFTLQIGRKAFEHRVAILARTKQELMERLTAFISGKRNEGVVVGNVKNADAIVKLMSRSERLEVIGLLSRRRDTNKIARLWTDGVLLDWRGVNGASTGKRVSLPTYPFSDKRHWVPATAPMPGMVASYRAGINALIDSNESTFERQLFKKSFHEREFFIYDHLVMGVPTLPGVAYLELARKAGELAAGRPVRRLHNVIWVSPIAVRADSIVDAWVELKPANDSVRFEVFSDDKSGKKVLHSQGRLTYSTERELAAPADYIDLAGIKARCEKVLDGRDAYPLFKSFGLNLGPSFQSLQEVYRGASETLGLLKLPASRLDDLQTMLLHPSLVDGALQAGVAAQLGTATGEMLVPFSIGEVEVVYPLVPTCWTYVTEKTEGRVENSRVSRKNVVIMDEDGKVLVRIKEATGVPITEVNKEPAVGKDDAGFAKLYYEQQWESTPLPVATSSPVLERTDAILLFDTDNALRDLYRRQLDASAPARRVVLVRPAAGYCEIDSETFEIDPADPQHFVRLLDALAERNCKFREICFGWSLRPGITAQNGSALQDTLESGVYAVLNLCQALVKSKVDGKLQLLYVYATGTGEIQLQNEAMSGFFRAVHLEFPKLSCKALEVRQDAWALDPVLAAISAEYRDDAADSVAVRYLDGERQIRKLKSFDLARSVADSTTNNTLREGGVYLITGGAGGLGLIFARHLASTYKARLLLTGRSKLSEEREAALSELRTMGAEVAYIEADVSNLADAQRLLEEGKRLYGEINGIIHSAGVLRDSYVRNKTRSDFEAVLAPKIYGTLNLDELTAGDPLDFFVLFSSMAAVGGNAGQSDYGYANHFMDSFAYRREEQRKSGIRHGRTLSLNWSLWADGGMRVDEQTEQLFTKTLGMKLLATDTGIEAFVEGLASDATQLAVLEGVQEKIEIAWGLRKKPVAPVSTTPSTPNASAGSSVQQDMAALVQAELTRIAMEFLKLDADDISPDSVLLDLGFDSIGLTTYANEINDTYGVDVTPVLFFDYPSIQEVAKYLAAERSEEIGRVHNAPNSGASAASVAASVDQSIPTSDAPIQINKGWNPRAFEAVDEHPANRTVPANRFAAMPIAIVGMSGVMPQSDDLEEFWNHLQGGDDLITVIPRDRWNWEEFYGDPFKEVNKSNSKWGGFMKEVDKFDALFFGISKREAQMMDPQQRIFLETVWKAIEDSGHRVSDFSGTRTGLFVGAATNDYVDVLNRLDIDLDGYSASGNSHSVLANRISFLLNLRGPSAPIDTACSSSLVALHRAIESIHTGSCDMAIVGGVQVMLSPAAYISFGMAGMLSNDGKCKTFDKKADGYVRGEGSGAIVIKPLSQAEAEGDHIYAVIRATSENHGGRVTTLTAPNSAAQAELLIDAYDKAEMDPGTVGYIECHGTGTGIGDPIEIQALTKAFSELYKKHDRNPAAIPHCGLSSAKTNIGHLETAAGIAGILRVLLAIKHRRIPANVHFEEINPYIKLEGSPFYIADRTRDWEVPISQDGKVLPRRAGVSSFGFGGANAHIVLEEYVPTKTAEDNTDRSPQLVVLSAKTADRLHAYVEAMLAHIDSTVVDFADFAYTLQVGRDEMPERLALVAADADELGKRFRQFLDGESTSALCRGTVRSGKKDATAAASLLGAESLQALMEQKNLQKLAEQWVLGADIDWRKMPRARASKRLAVPTYPFARERCWIPGAIGFQKTDQPASKNPSKAVKRELSPPSTIAAQVSHPSNAIQTSFYRDIWHDIPASPVKKNDAQSSVLLLFAGGENVREAIKRGFNARGQSSVTVVLVKLGQEYREFSIDSYEMDSSRPDDYATLFASLRKHELVPAAVVHAWSGRGDVFDHRSMASSLNQDIESVLLLTQNLIQSRNSQTQLRASTVAGSKSVKLIHLYSSQCGRPQPHHAAVASFMKSVMLEAPQLDCKSIGFVDVPDSTAFTDEMADRLIDELGSDVSAGMEVRYHSGRRSVKKLQEYDRPVALRTAVRERGTYVITGGAGGLGLIMAKFLASQSAVRLALIGRSPLLPSQIDAIEQLESLGAEVAYLRGDVANRDDVFRLLDSVRERFGSIHGIIHAAGVIRDAPIEKKTVEDLQASCAPKIGGTIYLDEASRSDNLDFFALFSSLAAVVGSPGQCDYAYANGFQSEYAGLREGLVAKKLRHGRTVTFEWPLWKDGGMQFERIKGIQLDEKTRAYLQESSGMHPLETTAGLSAFMAGLIGDENKVLVVHGNQAKIGKILGTGDTGIPVAGMTGRGLQHSAASLTYGDDRELHRILKHDLQRALSEVLLVEPSQIEPDVNLSEYGLDSIGVANLFRVVNGMYALDIAPAVLFEYPSFDAFSNFLLTTHTAELREHYSAALENASSGTSVQGGIAPVGSSQMHVRSADHHVLARTPEPFAHGPVAIIGLGGVFPGADTPEEFWRNILGGADLISEVPSDRWDWRAYKDDSQNGKSTAKARWGGFIRDVDKFDAAFFGIGGLEASLMDPQQRLFLQTAWNAIEDSGHKPSELAGTRTGVYVGLGGFDYVELLRNANVDIVGYSSTGMAHCVLPNRLSYLLDLRGPSEAIDTACSSSLVALHHAIEAISNGTCTAAIAGGVNLMLTPTLQLSLHGSGVLAGDGRCKTFDHRADGYVRGEGCVAVYMKRLDLAVADNDTIYGVVKGSGVNHGGRAMSLTSPNPVAQADLLIDVYRRSNVDPSTVGLIEAHGTGTALGDAIELNGLKKAFRELSDRDDSPTLGASCAVSSVKTNIGHLEAASGIASLIKVLLAIRYRKIPGVLHFEQLNPQIRLDDSPFRIVQTAEDWVSLKDASGYDLPLTAGISSLGFGGVNAHVIVQEYLPEEMTPVRDTEHAKKLARLILLSAKDEARLRQRAGDLLDHLERHEFIDGVELAKIAYTLQVGRECMDERFGFLASTADEIKRKLRLFAAGEMPSEGAYRGGIDRDSESVVLINRDRDIKAMIVDKWLSSNDLGPLLELWSKGVDIDWQSLYGDARPARHNLPAYPFAHVRHWVDTVDEALAAAMPEQDRTERAGHRPSVVDAVAEVRTAADVAGRVIKNELAEQLQVPAGSLATDKNLLELGVTSLGIASLVRVVNRRLELDLSPSIIFEYPTIAKFSAYLGEIVPGIVSHVSNGPTSSPSVGANAHPRDMSTSDGHDGAPSTESIVGADPVQNESERIESASDILEKIKWQNDAADGEYERLTF
ncbi:MAG: SDR family NAD(P)-dependent oxidoreductase [Lysobacteraceae bacterium]